MACYVLAIKDRHNGNILVRTLGSRGSLPKKGACQQRELVGGRRDVVAPSVRAPRSLCARVHCVATWQLDRDGHLVHIDFGFILGRAPGGVAALEAAVPFKLTREMVDVLGGPNAPLFTETFVELCTAALRAVREHADTLLALTEVTDPRITFTKHSHSHHISPHLTSPHVTC